MALLLGTITVNADATYTATGLVKRAMDVLVVDPYLALPNPASPPEGITAAQVVEAKVATLKFLAAIVRSVAKGVVDEVQANADVIVPIDAIEPGFPTVQRTLAGAVD